MQAAAEVAGSVPVVDEGSDADMVIKSEVQPDHDYVGEDGDDDCQIVPFEDAAVLVADADADAESADDRSDDDDDDDDGMVMTGNGQSILADHKHMPHLKCNCTTTKPKDKAVCGKCFCLVCNIVASECKVWAKHFEATWTPAWLKERAARKAGATEMDDEDDAMIVDSPDAGAGAGAGAAAGAADNSGASAFGHPAVILPAGAGAGAPPPPPPGSTAEAELMQISALTALDAAAVAAAKAEQASADAAAAVAERNKWRYVRVSIIYI